MAFQPIDTTLITYGATRTTAFTATITASQSEGNFKNSVFPSPPITESLQFTALPPVVLPASKYQPSSLLILIVTEVVAIILNTDGTAASTETWIQNPPTQSNATPLSAARFLMDPKCSSFSCWPPGQRIGTAVAIALFILGVMGLLYWGFCTKRRKRVIRQDLEGGRDRSRERHAGRRRSSRSPSPASSYDITSSSSREPAIQSYVRTRSRSRAREYREEPWGGVNSRGPLRQQPQQPMPHSHTCLKDFAGPAAAGIAAVTALGAAASGKRASISAPRMSSFHEENVLRGRQLSNGTRAHANRNCPRARSPSPTQGGHSKSNGKQFGGGFGLSDKWLALLPFIFDILYRWSKPKGGWEKYHRKDKDLENQAEDSRRKPFDSKPRARSRSPHRQYQEYPRHSHSVDRAYAQFRPQSIPRSARDERTRAIDMNRNPERTQEQPLRPKSPSKESSNEFDMSRSPKTKMQKQLQEPKTMIRETSYISASAEPRIRRQILTLPAPQAGTSEKRSEVDKNRSPSKRIRDPLLEVMDRDLSGISAAAEAGSRPPSPPPTTTGRSERRRITRREARKRREMVENNTGGGTGGEGSAAEDQKQGIKKSGWQATESAPELGHDRESSLPLSTRRENIPPEQHMAATPSALGPKKNQILGQETRQGQEQLLTPPDSDSHWAVGGF